MKRRRYQVAAAATTLLTILGALGLVLAQSDESAFRNQDERMVNRVEVASGFVRSYVSDILNRERAQAEALLPERGVRGFDGIVASFGFHAAVQLDGRGKLIAVWPHKRSLVGSDFAGQ